MTEPSSLPPRSGLSRDAAMLAAIVFCTMLLLNYRYHDRVVEQNRGMVFYTPDISRTLAMRLGRALRESGLFDGVPRVVRVDQPAEKPRILIAVADETFTSDFTLELLKSVLQPVCVQVFGDTPAEVWLMDVKLEPKQQLLVHPSGGK